jgi:hypothetical protein
VRNDLQTLASLLRLSRRRATAEALLDEFPGWLNAVAAVYDAHPLWSQDERVRVDGIVQALKARRDLPIRIHAEEDAPPTVPAASCVAVALSTLALLAFCAEAAAPGSYVQVYLRGDEESCRIEAVFTARDAEPAGWPPFGLAMGVEAMDAQSAMGRDGDDTVAVLVVPCR